MRRSLLLLVVVIAAGCRASGLRAGERTVRDSLGVRLVTLGVPDTLAHQWTIDIDHPLVQIGGNRDSTGLFGKWAPRSAVQLADGRIVVALDEGPHLAVFDSTGHLLSRFGAQGEGPGEFREEPRIFRHGDSVIVVDWHGNMARIALFGPDLKFAREYRVTFADIQRDEPYPIGVADDGRILFRHQYVALGFTGPNRAPAEVYSANPDDGDAHRIVNFPGEDRFGLPGGVDTYLVFGREPAMSVADNLIYAGANEGFTVNRYDTGGRLHAVLRVLMPDVPVTKALRAGWTADQSPGSSPDAQDAYRQVMASARFAQTVRPYDAFVAADDGGVWVERTRLRDADPHRYWIFDSTGRFVATASLPAEFKPLRVWNDRVLVRGYDGDKSPLLAIYGIVH